MKILLAIKEHRFDLYKEIAIKYAINKDFSAIIDSFDELYKSDEIDENRIIKNIKNSFLTRNLMGRLHSLLLLVQK